jgi:hypothetical protein
LRIKSIYKTASRKSSNAIAVPNCYSIVKIYNLFANFLFNSEKLIANAANKLMHVVIKQKLKKRKSRDFQNIDVKDEQFFAVFFTKI